MENNRIIGIVGGMGPQAGIALYNSIVRYTVAATDQEHLSAMLMSFPGDIVDRTSFLDGTLSVNPAYSIVEIIRKLEVAGAGVIGIACNTSYSPAIYNVVLEELAKVQSLVRVLNMPEETGRYIIQQYPQARRIGVLATNGTYRSGVYNNMLERMGFETAIPDFSFQQEVIHRIIYDPEFGLKAKSNPVSEQAKLLWTSAVNYMRDRGADTIILGCTELSLLPYDSLSGNVRIVDSTQSLAMALIREATAGMPPKNARSFISADAFNHFL
nr:amino acid racemase [uncultured Chitinophaga sp.]